MKLHISDLMEANQNDPVMSLLTSPAKMVQEKQALIHSKIMEESKAIFELKKLESNEERHIGSLLEDFEMAVLSLNSKDGIQLISVLEGKRVENFGNFSSFGKYKKLKKMFIENINFERYSYQEFIKCVDVLHSAELYEEAQKVFYSGFSYLLNKKRNDELDEIKNSEGVITNIEQLCKAVKSIFMVFLEMSELLKSRFLFGKKSSGNTGFGWWCSQQASLTLNEIFISVSEKYLTVWKEFDKLIGRLEVVLGSFDPKGLSFSFIFEEFVLGIKKETNYNILKESEIDFVSSEELFDDDDDNNHNQVLKAKIDTGEEDTTGISDVMRSGEKEKKIIFDGNIEDNDSLFGSDSDH